ncbi:hypothetical protein HZS_1382 [Henneguya salminicola]|nr:hypothetical protein HZS_1382 [Henneguya salminicola]
MGNPCKNNGNYTLVSSPNQVKIIIKQKKFFSCICKCPNKYFGKYCNYEYRCKNCKNVELKLKNTTIICECGDNYSGKYCEINCTKFCLSHKCKIDILFICILEEQNNILLPKYIKIIIFIIIFFGLVGLLYKIGIIKK